MPLVHSASQPAFKKNVKTLMSDVGKSPHIQTRAQALKIAYETQRRARASGGVAPHFDLGGSIDPQQQGVPPAPGVMPSPGNAPVGVAGPDPAMTQPNAPAAAPMPMPGAPPPPPMGAPQSQSSGVAQNAAPPAVAQNAPASPGPATLGAAPTPVAPGKPLMANGGALQRAAGGPDMSKSPNLSTPWQTKGADRRLHVGPVLSNVPGRTDNHRVKVPSGSYVLPAQHVASIGQGNSIAGLSLASSMFGGPYGASPGKIAHGSGAPRPPRMMKGLADGGEPPEQDYGQPVDVDISGGEYVVAPEAIIHRYGDLDIGHKILDKWVMDTRKAEIALQKKLPPPAKA